MEDLRAILAATMDELQTVADEFAEDTSFTLYPLFDCE